MAKRTRGRALHETGDSTAPARRARPARPRRRPTSRDQGLLDRYRTALIAGVALIGVVIIGFIFLQGASGAAYECRNLLTPGPVETPPTPRPQTPSPSPTAGLTAVPTPSPGTSPRPATSPGAGSSPSPGTSPVSGISPSPDASPVSGTSPSPDASPAPEASPTGAPSPTAEPTATPTARLGFAADDLGRDHAPTGQPLTYDYCPPASGPHYAASAPNPAPMPPAVYPPSQERAPGYWVHNLEHGYIVVLYRCPSGQLGEGDCVTREEMNQLEAFFEQAPDPPTSSCPNKTVVARFDEMDTRFAVLAWDRALLVDEFNLDEALTFADQWMEYDPVVLPELQAC